MVVTNVSTNSAQEIGLWTFAQPPIHWWGLSKNWQTPMTDLNDAE